MDCKDKLKVGDKAKGFRFDGVKYYKIAYIPDVMDEYIDVEGVVTSVGTTSFCIEFEDGHQWEYPIITDPIVESVINQFKTRSEIGIKKYGTTLERNDLTTLEWLQHLQEELMDAVCYIEKLKQDGGC